MIRVSHSQLKCKKNCERQYYYKYIAKLGEKNVETKWADQGKAMHETLEEYYNQTDIDYQTNLITKWEKYKLDDRMDFNIYKMQVLNGVALNCVPVNVEKKIFFGVDKYYFVAYIDIDEVDKTLDWKSGTYTKAKENEYKKQLICYSYCEYKKNNKFKGVASLFFNKANKEIKFKILEKHDGSERVITHQEILDYEEYIIDNCREIENWRINRKFVSDYKKNTSKCFFCGYKHLCFNSPKSYDYTVVIQNNSCFLEGNITPLLLEGIDSETRYDLKDKYWIQKEVVRKNHGFRPSNYADIGTTHLFNKIHRMFSLGHLQKVKKILKDYCEYNKVALNLKIDDRRDKEVMNKKLGVMPDKLLSEKIFRYYQEKGKEIFLDKKLGILNHCTGSGKTLIATELIRSLDTKTLFLIDRIHLLYQSKKVLEEELGIEIGIIGDSESDIKDVTIATVQTLSQNINKYKDFLKSINFAIIDEYHKAASESYKNVCKQLKNTKYRLGLTGTVEREDGETPVLFSLFGDVLHIVEAKELIEKGYLVLPKVIFYKIENLTIDSRDYQIDYKENIAFNDIRNKKIKQIINENKNKKILVITKLVGDHGIILHKDIKNSLHIHSGTDKKKRFEYMEKFRNEKNLVLISTTQITGYGLDIPDLDMIINVSGNKSDTTSIQAIGRVLRIIEGKDGAYYIDFVDGGYHTKKHSKKRIEALKKQGYKVEILK